MALVVLLAALAASASGVSPTGQKLTDLIVTFVVSALFTWAGSRAPWWLLALVGGVAAGCGDHRVWSAVAVMGAAGALAIGYRQRHAAGRAQLFGAISGGLSLQGLVHLKVNPYLGASALIAGVTGVIVIVAGVDACSPKVRHRFRVAGLALFVMALLFTAAFGLSTYIARDKLTSGYDKLSEGLRQLRAGKTVDASRDTTSRGDRSHRRGSADRGHLDSTGAPDSFCGSASQRRNRNRWRCGVQCQRGRRRAWRPRR